MLRFVFSITCLVVVLGLRIAYAQDYPNKPVRMVTATPGGGGDFAARLIGQAISGPLGQPVIVDNRTTILAAEAVAKAPPDGIWGCPSKTNG